MKHEEAERLQLEVAETARKAGANLVTPDLARDLVANVVVNALTKDGADEATVKIIKDAFGIGWDASKEYTNGWLTQPHVLESLIELRADQGGN